MPLVVSRRIDVASFDRMYEDILLNGPYDGVETEYLLPVPAVHTATEDGPKIKLVYGSDLMTSDGGENGPDFEPFKSTPSLAADVYDRVRFLGLKPRRTVHAYFVAA